MKFFLPIRASSDDFRWREYRYATGAVFLQGIIGAISIIWYWRILPPKIPLWYSKPWGGERLASPYFLALPIVSAITVYLINTLIVSRHVSEHPLFARALFLVSTLVSLLSVGIVVKIITLIT